MVDTPTPKIPYVLDSMGGAGLAPMHGLDVDKVLALFDLPHSFFSVCKILREDETTGYADPTPYQIFVLNEVLEHRWNIIDKFRQAKMTTCIALGLILRDCLYLEGVQGIIIAHDQMTAEMVFERILIAYENLPASVQMPLAKGRQLGTKHIKFRHGGGIKVLTMGSRAPGVGHSVDRVLITELGESTNQKKGIINLFPTFNKRDHARVIVESTPGRAGSHHEHMWHLALEGRGRFNPIFLEWWHDPSCVLPVPDDYNPSMDELKILATHKGMSKENLVFRRVALETEFIGDERLFQAKYPTGPYDGWLGSSNPLLPDDSLKRMLKLAIPDSEIRDAGHYCFEIMPPDDTRTYLITADPAGFGGKSGDPSALTVWDANTMTEVAFWEGREDPNRFASRLQRISIRYKGQHKERCMIAVESNAAACIATLRDRGIRRLLWTNRNHPGWYATAARLQGAESRLVRLLRDQEMVIRSKGTLHQLLSYDGSRRDNRMKADDGETHHFDRARTVVMAADIFTTRRFRSQLMEDTDRDPMADVPQKQRAVTIADLDRERKRLKSKMKMGFGPPPRDWT